MNKCKNCYWWGNEVEDEDFNLSQLPGGEAHKNCTCPKVGGGSYADKERMGLDSLNSYESVGTGPEFGCVHWKPDANHN
jgi:hypothetical protein